MIALFIGRFQPFHKGHLWAVNKILGECDSIIIGIGSSQYSGTHDNPFSSAERKEMIRGALAGMDVPIFEIPDIHDNNEWVSHVKRIVPEFDVVYTGSELSEKLFVRERIEVRKLSRHEQISASEVRLRIIKDLEYKDLVPDAVADILIHIDAKNRLTKRLLELGEETFM